jgi:hypothetical protein
MIVGHPPAMEVSSVTFRVRSFFSLDVFSFLLCMFVSLSGKVAQEKLNLVDGGMSSVAWRLSWCGAYALKHLTHVTTQCVTCDLLTVIDRVGFVIQRRSPLSA